MTRQQMIKRSFKPYMVLELETHNSIIDVILVSVDFDNEVFVVRPFDVDVFENEDLHVSISKLSFKKVNKLKLIK